MVLPPAPKVISEQRNSMPIWIHMALKKIKDVVIVRIDVDGVEMLVGDVFT